ncbi:MAG: hypothetical protein IJC46_06345 [Clostridia bacterium]|nr:hypothetical protein [Clostridia bacterium]
MKRPLLVFAGQSNMMGAAIYPAAEQIYFQNSAEYLHKPRRFGAPCGAFKAFGFPTGEFSYMDLQAAYGDHPERPSSLNDYAANTYFCPSMATLKSDPEKTTYHFADFSEANNTQAVSLPPILVQMLEQKGLCCAYTHIAKGSAPIRHFVEGPAADYFDQKATDFFADAAARYAEDDTSERALIWLQGESDDSKGFSYYSDALKGLWHRCKALGFTKFLIIRVGYWGNPAIADVMQAQEQFCAETPDAFILTRAASYLPFLGQPENWLGEVGEEFSNGRDSYFGFTNQHINQKGFETVARYALPNLIRILWEQKDPILEPEQVSALRRS